ncbi:MAG: alkaline phosphatase family protein [Gemmatimonadota bacterium]
MKRMAWRLLPAVALILATTAPTVSQEPTDSVPTQHLVVVSIDGLRPDAIDKFGLKTLQRLMDEGSYTLEAQTIYPSKTLPSHTSMLTGQTPDGHGIAFNSGNPDHGVVAVPTIFELARAGGLHTAGFFSKAKFRHLDRADAYDYRQAPSSNADNWMATQTVPDAIQYLRRNRPNLIFVHIGEPDYAGHGAGWMSYIYGLATRRADGAVARILEAAEDAYGAGNFTVMVTSDHGGHGRSHGTDDPRDMTIPWIVWGKGVDQGATLDGVRIMDTAATALWLLGVEAPGAFHGRLVHAAFTRVLAGADR